MIRRLMARPRPVPPWPRLVVTSGSKILPMMSAGMPLPSSRTRITTRSLSSATEIQMFPPSRDRVAGVEQDVGQNLLQVVEVPAHAAAAAIVGVDVDALRP